MATLDDINLFDRYLQTQQLQRDQDQAMSEQFATTPAQATYIAAMLAPGSGYIDAQGVRPSYPPSEAGMKDAFSGEPMPSMTQNLTEGNYLDLALQGLGVVGDTAYGIPLAGPIIGTGIKSLATLGAIAKGSKATKPKLNAKNLIENLASKKDGDTLNELSPQNFNYTKQNGIEVTLKDIDDEMAEEFPIIINDTTVYPDIELDVIANSGPKGTGAASKELDKVLKEIDDRDMSVSLYVDSKTAGKGDIGELSDIELKKWYQRKGFIFKEGSSVGYRASKSKPLPQKEFIDIPPSEKQNILRDLNKRNEKGYRSNDHEYLGELLENVQPKGYHEHYNDIYYSDGVNKAVRTNAGYSWKGPEDMFFGGDQTEALLDSGYVLRKPTSEGIASLPPTLTRNPSKAEIKQNFIDQHPPVGSIDSKTGKPVTEQLVKNRANAFEKTLKTKAVKNREELRMSTTTAAADDPLERIIKTPEDLLGKVLVPVTGDRSRVISGGMNDIRGIPLIQNIPVQGGPNYMIQHAGSGKAWASMENAANKKQMNMLFAADETGLDPYGVYSAMGKESINFSAPVATAMVAQLPALNIPLKHIKSFNETIRKGIGKTQEGRPDFVGLDSDDVFNQLLGAGNFPQKGAGKLRTIVVEEMQKPRWEKLGFPVYDDVLKTINEPSLMDIKTGEAGFGIFKGNPTKSTFPELGHQSYDTAIPGEYFGGLTASVPPEIMFPKTFDSLSKIKNVAGQPLPYSQQVGSLTMNPKLFEVADDEYVDQLIKYMNKNKGTNYAKGGIASLAHLK